MREEMVLSSEQQQYLDWLCTVPSERQPATKTAFAGTVSVDVKTLRRWEKKTVFRDEWEKRVNHIQGSPERTQRVLDTLYERALEGDTKSAQLYLQATNRMAPEKIEVRSDKKASEMTDVELDELIGAMAVRERSTRSLKAV
jgi:hypothetical protein